MRTTGFPVILLSNKVISISIIIIIIIIIIIKITISSLVIGLKKSYFPLIHFVTKYVIFY